MSIKFRTIPPKKLAQSITSASSSFVLNNILDWDGETALTASDFGTQLFAAIINDSRTKLELVELDPSTIASASITILKRGLSFDGGQTEVTANKLAWTANETTVQLGSDVPQLFQWLKDYADSLAYAGAPDGSTTVKGIFEEATQAEIDAGTASGGTSARLVVNPSSLATSKYTTQLPSTDEKAAMAGGDSLGTPSSSNKFLTQNSISSVQFGGTGVDGDLSIASGTTTIDLGSAQIVVKNYTSISITGTGKLAFSNPHNNGTIIILKSQGDVTLTSSQAPMIDCRSLGGLGGTGYVGATGSGTDGSDGVSFIFVPTGGKGGVGSAPTTGSLGFAGTLDISLATMVRSKTVPMWTGAGGGGGGTSSGSTGGDGGSGAGGLYIECGGAFNFTTSAGISVAGTNGSNGSGSNNNGGGGGGAGGSCIILYNTLTANTGTITVSAGSGGTGTGTGDLGGSGGGGYKNGTRAGGNTNGGAGCAGLSLVAQNTEFI